MAEDREAVRQPARWLVSVRNREREVASCHMLASAGVKRA